MTVLLSYRDVHAHYGAFHALKGVSFGVPAAQRIGLFGHNGSGKSTLLKVCVGALDAVSGDVDFGGEPIISGAVPRNVQRGIGYVPQTRNVFRDLTVERNLRIAGMRTHNHDIDTTLRIFPFLESRRHQTAGTMSGGEQQMLAFGMALMTRPKLLLLDEPTTGLSPIMANLLLGTVKTTCEQFGMALMIVEHNVPRTLGIIQRALIMKAGRIVSDTPSAELEGRRDLWEWF